MWEIAIKISVGKLKLDVKVEDLKTEILKNNFEILPLDFEHIIELSRLESSMLGYSPKLFPCSRQGLQ
jgi:PIN domain nuclease of toxin-antitoxin system